jgi:ABC-2 type transport system ATP-binding protein
MRIITGQTRPTLGRATIADTDAWHWRARRLIGYCPDVDAFYEEMTGREFVRTMAGLDGFSHGEIRDRTATVLDRVGMTDRCDRKLRGYSKGMRQRIKLAQALLTEPQWLVLDEPLSGIDPVGRQEMLDLFQQLAEAGTGLLISSHELEELGKLTNHVVVMARGRVAAVGTLTEIRDRMIDFPLAVRLEAAEVRSLAGALLALPGVTGVDLDGESSLVVRADHAHAFYPMLTKFLVERHIDVTRLTPLDDSAHAVLGHVLGGSGRT